MKIKLKDHARQLWLSLLLLVGVAAIAVPGLNGTNDSEIVEISTVEQLKEFRDAVNSANTYAGKTVKLTADLDLSDESNWTPIGNVNAYPSKSFNGTFDGDGHTISNVTSSDYTPGETVAGLFGSVVNGTIKNLTVKNVNISSSHYAAGIVGYSSNAPTIENCHVIGGTIKSVPGESDGGNKVGGIMGLAQAGSTINNCTVEGVTISGYREVGGIVGFSNGAVTNNTAINVTVNQDLTHDYKPTTPTSIGDIIGEAGSSATLSNNKVIKGEPVAKIGEEKYYSLSDAVAAAQQMGGAVTVELIDDISGETVTIKEVPDFKLTIDGKKDASSNYTVDARITIDGLRQTSGAGGSPSNGASVTLQNIAFVNSASAHGIQSQHYSHHVTIQNCTYSGSDNTKWFFDAGTDGPLYGVTIKDVTVEHARLIQANLSADAVFENIVATNDVYCGFNVKTGDSDGYTGTLLIKNCQVTTGKYAFRDYGDGYNGTITLEDNTFVSTSIADDEGAIVNRGGLVGTGHINVVSGTYTGPIKVMNNKEGVLAISGGYFSEEFPQEYIAADLVAQGKVCTPATDMEGFFTIGDPHYVAQIGEAKYVSLQAAINAAHETTGDVTITLIDDITGYSIVHQKAGLNLTIDGADKKVSSNIIVDGDGRSSGTETLTIKNIKFEGDGTNFCSGTSSFVEIPSCKTEGTPYYTNKYNYAHNITIDNCSFTSTTSGLTMAAVRATSGAGAYNVAITECTGTNLHSLAQLVGTTGGSFTNNTVDNSDSFVNLNGGGGEFSVSGNTFTSSVSDGYGIRENEASTAIITLTANNFTAGKAVVLGKGAKKTNGTINVVSGTYVGDIVKDIANDATGKIVISGGKFSAPIGDAEYAEFIAEGLCGINGLYPDEELAKNGIGTAVASVTNGETVTKYGSLEAAIAAAVDGNTITLLADIDTEAQVEVGKQVTLDMNGKTIEYKGSTTLTSGVLMVLRGGDLTMTDSSEGAAGAIKSGTNAYAAIALTKAGETGTETAKLTVNNGNLEGYYYAITGNGSRHGTEITINGGVIKGTCENDNLGIFHPQDGTLTITGGTITGYSSGVEMRAGTLNVTGGTITATSDSYSFTDSGSGNTTVGAAIAIAQHNTGKDITANITGATLSGTKLISVVDTQNNNLENVTVTASDDYIENTAIPADFKWVAAQTEGMSTLAKKTYVAQIGDDKYESLAAAVAAVPADGSETTITMIADENINNNAGVTIASGKNIILDLNGKSIVQTAPEAKTAATITNKGTLTIEDNAGGGSISMTGTPDANWLYGIWVIDNRNKLVINSGTIINNSARGLGFAVHTGAYGTSTTVEVNGGTISHPNYCAFCVYYQQGGSQIVNINGGTITGSASSIWYQICTDNPNIDMTISGGEIISTSDQYAPIYVWAYNSGFDATNVKMAIKGGYVNTNGVSDVIDWDDAESAFVNLNKKVISGGKFSVNPDAYVAEGYISTANTDPETKVAYPYAVKQGSFICAIGTTKYETLQDAINACEAGTETTIKLLDNVTDGAGFAIPDGVTNKNIIIDFDGKTYNVSKDAVGSSTTKSQAMHFYSGNTLTLKNGTITSAATSDENKLKMMMQNYCDLTLDGMIIDCSNVNGGTYENIYTGADAYWNNKSVPVFNFNTGNATIKNTTITFRDGDNMGLCVDGGTVALGEGTVVNGPVSAVTGTVTITDGKYSGAVTADQASLQIYGGIFTEKPADEYCAEGYIVTDNTDEETKDAYPFTVKSKEDAGIFELKDWEVYPYLSYTEDKEAASVTYIRRFDNTNWQALYIPFDINDISELTDKYEFAKIHMVALENDGQWTKGDKIEVYYTKMTEGKIHANKPYLIKPKNSGEQSIVVENTILHDTHNVNPMQTETTAAVYAFTGTYEGVDATSSNTFFAMGGGTINFCDNVHLGAYRWYLNFEPKTDDYAKPIIDFIESDSDATGVSSVKTGDDSDIEGYYSINGVRSETPVRGINIIRYKNGSTRKVVIK